MSVVSERLHIPEVFEPDEKLPADLLALRKFAWYLDDAFVIPGTSMRVGASSIIGLIPGFGDIAGALLSTWIIAGALRHRVPAWIIARMVFNVGIDLVFGSIPIAGDIFDFLYEENVRNMRLLEAHRDKSRRPRTTRRIALILILIIMFLLLLALAVVVALIAVVIWLIGSRAWV
jgi:hypothetical protein